MPQTLAFDVYGTLIDTGGVVGQLTTLLGEAAPEFSRRWREKQLEYSFRRGLMAAYRDFSVCTDDALRYTSAQLGLPLSDSQAAQLMAGYRTLPAFDDARQALPVLQAQGHRLFAFSNGVADDLAALLEHAGLAHFFEGIVSADEIGTFKPDPELYAHFCRRAECPPTDTWLVSGNPFDLVGAAACGFHTAWVRRDPTVPFDPWGARPDMQLATLTQLSSNSALQP